MPSSIRPAPQVNSPNPYEPPSVPSAANKEEGRLRLDAEIRFAKRLAVVPPLVGAVVSLLPLLVFGPLRPVINRHPWPYFLLPLNWDDITTFLVVPLFFIAVWVVLFNVVKRLSRDRIRRAGLVCILAIVPLCIATPMMSIFWLNAEPVTNGASWITCTWLSGLFSTVFLFSGLGLVRLAQARRVGNE